MTAYRAYRLVDTDSGVMLRIQVTTLAEARSCVTEIELALEEGGATC